MGFLFYYSITIVSIHVALKLLKAVFYDADECVIEITSTVSKILTLVSFVLWIPVLIYLILLL